MIKAFVVVSLTWWLILFPSAGMTQEGKSTKLNYVGITAGGAFPEDLESSERTLFHTSLPDANLSDALMLGVRLGHTPQMWYKMSPIVVELEASMITKTDAKSANYVFNPVGSSVTFATDIFVRDIMLNFLLRHPYGRVHPFAGFGLGWTWFDIENARLILEPGFTWPGTASGVNNQGDLSDDAFGYQFLLGVSFDLTDTVSLDLGYRYFQTEPEFKFRQAAYTEFEAPVDLNVKMTYKTHVIGFGLSLWF
ncbi:MAG: porin family protein [Desulfobacterales bacterium]|jgi:opacity protein-like surface antigen|nr:MAG: porin family protein [Desulfobacterales bacterium]